MNKKLLITAFPTFLRPYRLQALRDYRRLPVAFLLALVVMAFSSCGSDEPQWADPEGHERTEQLRKQYGPLIVGSWHYEKVGERQRFFATFGYADETTLHIQGYYVHDDDGWADYQCREAESSF